MKKSILADFRSQPYQFMSLGACLLLFLFVSCSKENTTTVMDDVRPDYALTVPSDGPQADGSVKIPTIDNCNCAISVIGYQGPSNAVWGLGDYTSPPSWSILGLGANTQNPITPLPSAYFPVQTSSNGYTTVRFTNLNFPPLPISLTYRMRCTYSDNGASKVKSYDYTLSHQGDLDGDGFPDPIIFSLWASCEPLAAYHTYVIQHAGE